MKRAVLILTAVGSFALATMAQAESSVTLYGLVDTGYGYSKKTYDKVGIDYSNTSSGLHDSYLAGSRFGFRGVEDLGDGLRAIFVLESGINPSDGTTVTDRMFHRESNVGLSSDSWGTFTMGRQYNLADPFFGINSTSSMGDIDKTFGAASVRVDNMFRYTTPFICGFQAGVGYAANGTIIRMDDGGDTHNRDRSNYLSLGVQYTDQSTHAALTYDRMGGGGQLHAADSWALIGAHDFGIAKVALGYGQDRYAKINGVGAFGDPALFGEIFTESGSGITTYDEYLMAHDFKAKNYYVGVSIPVGGGVAGFAWARTTSNLDDPDKLGSFGGNQTIYSTRYVYPLSKRTSVYAYGSYGTDIAYFDGLTSVEAGMGLHHNF